MDARGKGKQIGRFCIVCFTTIFHLSLLLFSLYQVFLLQNTCSYIPSLQRGLLSPGIPTVRYCFVIFFSKYLHFFFFSFSCSFPSFSLRVTVVLRKTNGLNKSARSFLFSPSPEDQIVFNFAPCFVFGLEGWDNLFYSILSEAIVSRSLFRMRQCRGDNPIENTATAGVS